MFWHHDTQISAKFDRYMIKRLLDLIVLYTGTSHTLFYRP
jgi:hypothetical protein